MDFNCSLVCVGRGNYSSEETVYELKENLIWWEGKSNWNMIKFYIY